MACVCYCECKKRRKRLTLNIVILILSTICVILDGVTLAIHESIGSKGRIAFEVILIVANSIVSAIQSFQLKLESPHHHKSEGDGTDDVIREHNRQVIVDTLSKQLSKTDLRDKKESLTD